MNNLSKKTHLQFVGLTLKQQQDAIDEQVAIIAEVQDQSAALLRQHRALLKAMRITVKASAKLLAHSAIQRERASVRARAALN